MSELIADLKKVSLLAGIEDELLERIAQVVTTRVLKHGDALVTEGSIGEDLYFVRQGNFLVSMMDGEVSIEIARLGPGDVVGETQLIAGGRRTATVTAIDDCIVLCLPHEEFDKLIVQSDALREAVARVIRHRLRESALRVALPHAVGSDQGLLDRLSQRATWVRLERAETLWEQGDEAEGWYVLVSGELSIFVEEHGIRRKTGSVRRGEVFGEVALIRSEPRYSSCVATRDSWLAHFDAQLLDQEILTRTSALRTLVLSLATRLSVQTGPSAHSARVIAVVPLDENLEVDTFIDLLNESMGDGGMVVNPALLREEGIVGDADNLPAEHPAWLRFEAWVESRRQDKSHLLLVSSCKDNSWTEAAYDHADTVLLIGNADSDPAPKELERSGLQRNADSHAPPVWLALEHPPEREMPSGTLAWLQCRDLEHHAHFRRGHRRDIARLGRWLMGTATGMALSGGGARGFVHLGIAAELRNSGLEVDLFAGTSAGAMAGGLLALDGDTEQKMAGALVAIEAQGNPFVEFDLPIIALLRSRRLRDGLHATYGEVNVEDCWIPLRIVATDLTESRRVVFDRGPLWQRVFAASSPPGVMPPVKDGEKLLCDGGLVDNLPVSVLIEENCKRKLASYVGSAPILPAPDRGFPTSWSLLFDKLFRRGRHKDVPTLITTLFQCVSVPASAQLENARQASDLFFHPDLSEFSVTDVNAARAMFEAGKAHARAVLDGPTSDGNDT